MLATLSRAPQNMMENARQYCSCLLESFAPLLKHRFCEADTRVFVSAFDIDQRFNVNSTWRKTEALIFIALFDYFVVFLMW